MQKIKFGFNHMIAPSLTPDELVAAAAKLGASAIELRNDIGANSLNEIETARRVGAKARDAGLEVRSVNALYPFNFWSDDLERRTHALAALAAASGATGLVMCPLNENKFVEDTEEKAENLRAALRAIQPILAGHGLKGFVEPLGFLRSSLRFKREALAAIDDINGANIYSLVHDTFHHMAAGETEFYPHRTGLVHISGLENTGIAFSQMEDADRVLIGLKDRLENEEQLRHLYAGGYDGVVSFEPFAKEIHDLPDPIQAVRASMDHLRAALCD